MGSASSFMRPSKRNVATTTNATASSNEPMNLTPINAAQQPPSRPPIHPSTANQVAPLGHTQLPQSSPSTNVPLSIQPVGNEELPHIHSHSNLPSTASSPRVAAVDLSSNVPYTPKGSEADIFRYYCPLCMLYFKNILKGACCGNYICFACTRDYVATKGLDHIKVLKDIEINAILFAEITCPNCFTNGFHPIQVRSDEEVRDYSWNDQPVPDYYQASPVRVGETFEDLKRKMISFKQASSSSAGPGQLTSSSGQDTVSSSVPTVPVTGPRGIAMVDVSPLQASRDDERGVTGSERRGQTSSREDENYHRLSSLVTAHTPRHNSSPRTLLEGTSSSRQMRGEGKDQNSDDLNNTNVFNIANGNIDVVRRLALDSSRRGSREYSVEAGTAFADAKEIGSNQGGDEKIPHNNNQLEEEHYAETKALPVAEGVENLSMIDQDVFHDNLSEHNDALVDVAEESLLDGSTLTLAKIDINHQQGSTHSMHHSHADFSPKICEKLIEDQEIVDAVALDDAKTSFFSTSGIRSASPSSRKYYASEREVGEEKACESEAVNISPEQ